MSSPAGWYADPSNTALIRWWDGAQWTHYTQPAEPPQSSEPLSTEPPLQMRLDVELDAALREPDAKHDGPRPFTPTLSPSADGSGREAAAKALRQRVSPRSRGATLPSGIITILASLVILLYFGNLVKPASMHPQRGEQVVAATVAEISGPFIDGSCAPIAEVTIEGQELRAIARWNEAPCRWQPGSPVRVIYDPADVEASLRVDGSDRETWPTILVSTLGSAVMLLGIYRIGRAAWGMLQQRRDQARRDAVRSPARQR